MIAAVAAFELKKRLRMMSTWIYFVSLFASAMLLELSAAGAFSGISMGFGAEKVHANSPDTLRDIQTIVSLFGMVIAAGVFGQSLHEDVEHRTSSLLFSTPLKRRDYLAGRFAGAFITCLVIFSGIFFGVFLAGHLPSPITEETSMGVNHASYYAWPFLIDIVPNILIAGSLFFALAAWSRRMMPVYVGAIVLVTVYLLAGNLLRQLDSETLGALLDPFGRRAASLATKYWTVADKNAQLTPLTGIMLANRALWLGAAFAFLAFAVSRFNPVEEPRSKNAPEAEPEATKTTAATTATATTTAAASPTSMLALLVHLVLRSARETMKNTYFLVIVFGGAVVMALSSWQAGKTFETPTWPVTAVMSEATGGFQLFVLIVLIFSAGEIVWRERDARVAQIVDALPVPTWIQALTPVLALLAVVVVLMAPMLVCGVVVQTLKGYYNYELGVYVADLLLRAISFVPMAVLAVSLQVLINNKYLAHFAAVIAFVAVNFISGFGWLPKVLVFADEPGFTYSDMNGWGHFLAPLFWFRTYWISVAAVLVMLAILFYVRGVDTDRRMRVAEARRRLPLVRVPLLAAVAVAVAFASYIGWQTVIAHKFVTARKREEHQANYEKKYKATEKAPKPRITDVKVQADLFPHEQGARVHGTETITNKTQAPIDHVTLTLGHDEDRTVHALTIAGAAAASVDDDYAIYEFKLPSAIAPGASAPLVFDFEWTRHGFKNGGEETEIVDNGTFFNSSVLPSIGYQVGMELTEDNDRKKYGLAPRDRLPPPDAPGARDDNEITSDADWVTYDAVVSTSPEQIALMPGYLEKEWSENGRRYFHYSMDAPMLLFFSIVSADYVVKSDAWQDVKLQVFYDKKHPYNVDRMIDGMKDALAYCSAQFGPYQHRQLRIMEFPRYASFAQSFANTIPFSESIGFIARFEPDDDDAVDYPYFVTAHETAHQWWGHQVVAARAQGGSMLSETLAEYSALMIMKHKYGDAHMRRFLRQEADTYLRGRAFEQKREVPLMKVEDQPYIHYNKGGHVMYELQDAIGEDNVNAALAAFVTKWKGQGPPYAIAADLVAELKAHAPPEQQSLIVDLFETITLWDTHTSKAECTKRPDGRYDVTLDVSVKKVRASELGEETEVAVDRPLEVGALDEKGEPFGIEKRTIPAGQSSLTIAFDKPPKKAGLDPLVKLLDRKPDDNVVPVTCP